MRDGKALIILYIVTCQFLLILGLSALFCNAKVLSKSQLSEDTRIMCNHCKTDSSTTDNCGLR